MKKIVEILILIAIISVPFGAFAKVDIDGKVLFCLESEYAYNGKEVVNSGTLPFMYKNRSFVPVRFTVEALGGQITDYNNERIEIFYRDKKNILDISEAKIYNSVTYIPVKNLTDLLGLNLYWNDGLITISRGETDAIDFNQEQDLKFMLGFVTYTDRYNIEYSLYSNSVMYGDGKDYKIVNGKCEKLENKAFLKDGILMVPLYETVSDLGGTASVLDENGNYSVKYNFKNYYFPASYISYYGETAYAPIHKTAEIMKLKVNSFNGVFEITGNEKEYTPEQKQNFADALASGIIKRDDTRGGVMFSAPGGLYTKEFYLTLSSDIEDSVIYYTADGSDPTEESMVYKGEILIKDASDNPNNLSYIDTIVEKGFVKPKGKVFKGTVIKARAFDSEGNPGPISQNTYFVSEDIYTRYRGAKIISLSTPSENLFGEKGIYRYPNYLTVGNPNEVAGYMEIFDTEGNNYLSQSVGIRINGAGTRVLQQKSFRIYARQNGEYLNGDKKSFKCDLFDGKAKDISGETINKFKRIILRNTGDDWGKYYLRDSLSQSICSSLGLLSQEYSPAVVFINGEYWGVHMIRERYDGHYFEEHFNLLSDKDAVLIEIANDPLKATLSEGEKSDLEAFNAEAYFIINNDMSVDENYQIAQKYFDIDNMIDFYAVNIFMENVDWPHNNIKIWKNKNPENQSVDTRWRFVLSDMDCTMESLKTIYSQAYLPGDPRRSYWLSGRGGSLEFKLEAECLSNLMFNSLLKNEEFKNRFISRYLECIDNELSGENIVKEIEKRYEETIYLRTEHILRYPGSWSYGDTEALKKWALERGRTAKEEIQNYFGIKIPR